MLWVNIFLSLRSPGPAGHSLLHKNGCFLPLTGCIVGAVHLYAVLRTASRGQQTPGSGRVQGCPAFGTPFGTCLQRGNHYWITGCLLRSFSGLDTKALLLEGEPGLPQSRLQRTVNMTRPINYLIEVLGFEDEKCCVSGEWCCFQSGELYRGSSECLFQVTEFAPGTWGNSNSPPWPCGPQGSRHQAAPRVPAKDRVTLVCPSPSAESQAPRGG